MKKLIVAACAAMLGIAAQAGTVSWLMTNVYSGNDTTFNSGIAYMFNNATVAQTAIAEALVAAYTENGITAVNSYLEQNSTGVSWLPGTMGTYTRSSGAYQNSDLGLAGGTSVTLYAVIFDTASVTADSKFYVTNTKTATTKADSENRNTSFGFGSQLEGSRNADNWTTFAVPEPTSGLLLLLGMAGLALKRKVA